MTSSSWTTQLVLIRLEWPANDLPTNQMTRPDLFAGSMGNSWIQPISSSSSSSNDNDKILWKRWQNGGLVNMLESMQCEINIIMTCQTQLNGNVVFRAELLLHCESIENSQESLPPSALASTQGLNRLEKEGKGWLGLNFPSCPGFLSF